MKVFQLLARDRRDLGYNGAYINLGTFSSREVAMNAAELHAEEQLELDDVQLTFPISYVSHGTGNPVTGQFFPGPDEQNLDDPPQDWKFAYSIEEITVREEA